MPHPTDPSGFTIEEAGERDVPLILAFIRELAEYERLAHEVVLDEPQLHAHLFGERPYAEVLLAESLGLLEAA